MADVVIQNPVINSAFSEPARHFEFGERGIRGGDQRGQMVEAQGRPRLQRIEPPSPTELRLLRRVLDPKQLYLKG